MDFKMQNGQTQQPQRPAGTGGSFGTAGSGASKKLILLVVGVLVIVALVIGTMLFAKPTSTSTSAAKIDTSKYQAIFLTNGQVYFGKLSDINSGYVNINDVYYLQVQQAVQPADTKSSSEQPKVSLTKLGNELHGPTDEMHISRDQVLFWENLKSDSTVVKAINDYKSKQ